MKHAARLLRAASSQMHIRSSGLPKPFCADNRGYLRGAVRCISQGSCLVVVLIFLRLNRSKIVSGFE